MKCCSKCKKIKPLTEFHKCSRDGLQPRCKECRNTTPPREALSPGLQRCIGCKEVKAFSEFWKHPKGYFGLDSRCKSCHRVPIEALQKMRRVAVPPGSMRSCSKCKIAKPINAFAPDKKNTDRLNSRCRACCSESSKASHRKNKEGRKAYRKWYRSLPGKKELCSRLTKAWRDKNPGYNTAYAKGYYHNTIKNNPSMLIEQRIRGRLHKILKREKSGTDSSMKLIGCTRGELMMHLQKQFKAGMNWNNYGSGRGKWNVDHIRPCYSYDLTDREQQKACFHYSNLQPLWAEDNRKKWYKHVFPAV